MAYKQKGWSAFTRKQDLLKSEHRDTDITGGNDLENKFDVEDRISFIKEDIDNKGYATNQQRKDLKSLTKTLADLNRKI